MIGDLLSHHDRVRDEDAFKLESRVLSDCTVLSWRKARTPQAFLVCQDLFSRLFQTRPSPLQSTFRVGGSSWPLLGPVDQNEDCKY